MRRKSVAVAHGPVLISMALLAALVWPPIAAAVSPASAIYLDGMEPVTSANATFSSDAPEPGVHVSYLTVFPNAGNYYMFGLAGVDGAQIAPGTYPDATMPPQPGHPYFYAPPTCGPDSVGAFTVYEVTFAADESLTKLAFDYSIDCYNTTFHGAVRFNSAWPVRAVSAVSDRYIGDVSTAESVGHEVVVTSAGTSPVTVSGIGIEGDITGSWSVGDDTCTGRTLAAGATCTFDAVVSPTAAGALTAAYTVESDAFAPSLRVAFFEARGQIATTTTIRTHPSPVIAGEPFDISLTIKPTPDGGRVDVLIDGDGGGTADVYPDGSAAIHVGPLTKGPHTITVEYINTQGHYAWSSASQRIYAGQATSTTITSSLTRTYVGRNPTLTAAVSGMSGGRSGTLQIVDVESSAVLGRTFVSGASGSLTITPALPVGDRQIVAQYSGTFADSPSSAAVGVKVLPDDGVALLKVSVTPTTFYPYSDSYLDTVSIGGTLDETAAVSVSIYNSAGTRVYIKDLGSKSGVYATAWNGRRTSGAIQPAGVYKVVQTLKDTTGHTRIETTNVTLSLKRLYTYTTYVTKTVAEAAVKTPSWIGWNFTLPSATVYKSLQFQIYGQSTLVPGLLIGGWDFRDCRPETEWSPACVRAWTAVGFNVAWHGAPLFTTHNRSDRTVRGFALATGGGALSKARVKVVYGVLQ